MGKNGGSDLFRLLENVADKIFSFVCKLVNCFVSRVLMFQKEWPNDSLIDNIRSIVCDWVHAPHEQDALKLERRKRERKKRRRKTETH